MVNLLQFKPKPKIRIEEGKKEEKSVKVKKVNPHVILKRKEKQKKKLRRKPSCLDCVDSKLLKNDDFKGKTQVICFYWDIIVHPHRARMCKKFQSKR